MLTLGTTYYISVKAVNGAGLGSNVTTSNGQFVEQNTDNTPPTDITQVSDGTGTDLDSTTLTTELSANWTASTDA